MFKKIIMRLQLIEKQLTNKFIDFLEYLIDKTIDFLWEIELKLKKLKIV